MSKGLRVGMRRPRQPAFFQAKAGGDESGHRYVLLRKACFECFGSTNETDLGTSVGSLSPAVKFHDRLRQPRDRTSDESLRRGAGSPPRPRPACPTAAILRA